MKKLLLTALITALITGFITYTPTTKAQSCDVNPHLIELVTDLSNKVEELKIQLNKMSNKEVKSDNKKVEEKEEKTEPKKLKKKRARAVEA